MLRLVSWAQVPDRQKNPKKTASLAGSQVPVCEARAWKGRLVWVVASGFGRIAPVFVFSFSCFSFTHKTQPLACRLGLSPNGGTPKMNGFLLDFPFKPPQKGYPEKNTPKFEPLTQGKPTQQKEPKVGTKQGMHKESSPRSPMSPPPQHTCTHIYTHTQGLLIVDSFSSDSTNCKKQPSQRSEPLQLAE